MDVSIIVVNLNTRQLLQNCLASIGRNVRDVSSEVIVVDNGSTDGSCEMVARDFPDVRLICNAENRGFAAANNQAIPLAQGRYVLLLNSDTIVLGDVLRQSVRYMDRHSEVGILGCRVLNEDRTPQLTCLRFPTLVNLALKTFGLSRLRWPRFFDRYQMTYWARDDVRDVDTVTGCYMFCRARAIDDVGLLDESFFFYGEETDWCKRFWQRGWRLRFAPIGEIVHYGSMTSKSFNSRRDLMLTKGLLQYHQKHSSRPVYLLTLLTLLCFNASRSIYWSLVSVLTNESSAVQRRNHFYGVMAGFHTAFPEARGAK